jgi:hypothetical protein
MTSVIFANIVNELMIDDPSFEYAQKMNAVTPRKIWLAEPGDIVVTPVPIEDYFRSYAEDTLKTSLKSVRCFSPSGSEQTLLASRAAADRELMDVLRQSAQDEQTDFLCFCLDKPTAEFASQLGLNIAHYSKRPGPEVIDAGYRINTKNGFRRTVEALGLRVVPGRFCSAADLAQTVCEFGSTVGSVIVKANRSSNGYGHSVIRTAGRAAAELRAEAETIRQNLTFAKMFVVEEFKDFSSLPSVEIEVGAERVHVNYTCDQRCTNNSWTGIVTPPEGSPDEYVESLTDIGLRFGRHVQSLGFRGHCDVDCGFTTDAGFWLLESNFRRTGGTYLHSLVKRLVNPDYLDSHVWWADARVGRVMDFSKAVRILEEEDLRFDHETKQGVVLTADTTTFDKKWRYLILAHNHDQAKKMEKRIEDIFQLADTGAQRSTHLAETGVGD